MATENTTPNLGYQEPHADNPLAIDVGRIVAALRAIDANMAYAFGQLSGKASLASPVFTGTPQAPTPVSGTDSNQLATTAFVQAAIAALVGMAPEALDTIYELAAASEENSDLIGLLEAAVALKANSADVEAGLALKENSADVTAALALKQDIADNGLLTGFRNKLINGDFDVWQRGTSQTSNGYGSDDRWFNGRTTSTVTHSRQAFTLGQTDVPGNPEYFSRSAVTSGGGASSRAFKLQRIEGAATLSGKAATLTFFAKADATKNLSVEVNRAYGSGGSPSSTDFSIFVEKIALSTSWQKFRMVISVPSISGKTLGTDRNDCLEVAFWFDAGSDYDGRTDSLGNQSGTFDIAHVSLVEGDAMAEDDPFSPRHIGQELALCMRYLEIAPRLVARNYSTSAASVYYNWVFKAQKRIPPTFANLTSAGARTFTTEMDSNNGIYGVTLIIDSLPASTTDRTAGSSPPIADAEL